MSPVLDLGPLDRALADLIDSVTGQEAEDVLVENAQEFADAWRAGVESEGLVKTGKYRDSIRVEPFEAKRDIAVVQVFTDAVNDDGFPYPNVLEYTDHPVGIRAFDQKRRSVVKAVGESLGRSVRSRKARKRK